MTENCIEQALACMCVQGVSSELVSDDESGYWSNNPILRWRICLEEFAQRRRSAADFVHDYKNPRK